MFQTCRENYQIKMKFLLGKGIIRRIVGKINFQGNRYATKWIQRYQLCFLFVYSQVYNCDVDPYSIAFLDVICGPLMKILDHWLKTFGSVFVAVVLIMLILFVLFAYIIGFPFWYNRSKLVLTIGMIIGNWLLINVAWNYYKALYTLPGFATDKPLITEKVQFCRKCFTPKPPRCHHCSFCNRCILKMDHHCPWLNNCIGHYNHRYFYFFCAYTWFATIFVMIFGVWIIVDHWFPNFSPFTSMESLSPDIFIDWPFITDNFDTKKIRTKMIICEAIITVLIFILIGLLLLYHTRLITNGETSIERHINRRCRYHYSQFGVTYRNPYDFGPMENWRRFLGFDRNHRNPWRHILLPSSFPPVGNGFTWKKINDD